MRSRLELQQLLEDLLGSRNVYFEPPSNIRMKYPAIVYSLSKYRPSRSDGGIHHLAKAYDLTLIELTSESQFAEKLIALPYCSHDRSYVSDGLHHNTFTLYY